MLKVLGAVVLTVFGVGILLLTHEWFAWIIIISGLIQLPTLWRLRNVPPIDRVFFADAKEVARIAKADPAGAARLTEQAFERADQREQQHLAELRRRVKTDTRAAIELRNWLRYQRSLDPTIQRESETMFPDSLHRTRFLEELDRRASEREQELAEVEGFLADYPFYVLWRDQATGYLREFRSLPTGGPSAYVATLAPVVGVLTIFALMPMRSDIEVRMAVSSVAISIGVLGLVRPRLFWESAGVEKLREVIGDRMVALICIAMGFLVMVLAWVA